MRPCAAICPSALTFEAGFLPHEKSGSKARLYAQIERCDTSGLTLLHTFGGQTWRMRSPLVGEHNAFNLLGAEAAALGLGFSPKDMKGLEGFRGVPGRLERIEAHDADTGAAYAFRGIRLCDGIYVHRAYVAAFSA